MYGQTVEGLADSTGIPFAEAKRIVDIYDRTFSGCNQFRIEQGKMAQRLGYVTDLFGAMRHLPNAMSADRQLRSRAMRQAGNFPIQSTGNTMHLLAMYWLMESLLHNKFTAMACVIGVEHDKIYVDCVGSCLGKVVELVTSAMLRHNHMSYWKDKPVKLKVDVKYGENLYDMKEW